MRDCKSQHWLSFFPELFCCTSGKLLSSGCLWFKPLPHFNRNKLMFYSCCIIDESYLLIYLARRSVWIFRRRLWPPQPIRPVSSMRSQTLLAQSRMLLNSLRLVISTSQSVRQTLTKVVCRWYIFKQWLTHCTATLQFTTCSLMLHPR